MKFELSAELIAQLVFGMENQETIHLFDSQALELVPAEAVLDQHGGQLDADGRYLPLPEWKSVDGFNLMESFVGNLRNPIFREELRQILKNGRGVFRQFKNALKDRPDIERIWYRYRQKEMNQRVIQWYNDYCEIWGLEPYTAQEHDGGKDDLVFSDFDFRAAAAAESGFLADWDRQLVDEIYGERDAVERQYQYLMARRGFAAPAVGPDSPVVVATTPDGELAGFIWSIETAISGKRYGRIIQLGILPDFRGIGIASALIRWYHRNAREQGLNRIFIELPAAGEFLTANLKSLGFVAHSSVWEADLAEIS